MIIGNPQNIDVTRSDFPGFMESNPLYVDKSLFIEHFLTSPGSVRLICRQRRMGKSLNMDMLNCFLTDREDYRKLFENLLIRNSSVWEQANSSPVFFLDFKTFRSDSYQEQIYTQIKDLLAIWAEDPNVPKYWRESIDKYNAGQYPLVDALKLCTQIGYYTTGKRVYILIDEYDSLLTYLEGKLADYSEIRDFLSKFFSSGMKGNKFLAKALLIGVSRVSHEGLISALNNPATYDVFGDKVFSYDFGFSEEEMQELSELVGFDVDIARDWYNGIKFGGNPIFNTYGVMRMIADSEMGCYWGETGSLGRIVSLLNGKRKSTLISLLEPGSTVSVPIEERISPEMMFANCTDDCFYSYLVQTGYLALESKAENIATVSIPNIELRKVWESFILSQLLEGRLAVGNLFTNLGNPEELEGDITKYLKNVLIGLSFFDLATIPSSDGLRRVPEKDYHLLIYGILKAGADRLGAISVTSNREEGTGRYDISFISKYDEIRFEFKSAAQGEDLGQKAQEALAQILDNNYIADADPEKTLTIVGLAFYKKECAAAVKKIR